MHNATTEVMDEYKEIKNEIEFIEIVQNHAFSLNRICNNNYIPLKTLQLTKPVLIIHLSN